MKMLLLYMEATPTAAMALLLPSRAALAQRSLLPPTLARKLLFLRSLPSLVSDASTTYWKPDSLVSSLC